MTKQQITAIADHLKAVPVDALQRASLLYAAKRLAAAGETGCATAILLLEQMAGEHYDEMTVTEDDTVVVDVGGAS